jgi:hypothetical protein
MFHLYFSGRNPDYRFVKLMYCRHTANISVMAKDTEGMCVCVYFFLMLDYFAVNSSSSQSSGH